MGCSPLTSWPSESAEPSAARITSTCPFPRMLPDHALGRIRMRQSVVDGTILVLKWHDSSRNRIGKEHGRVHGREQEDILALARGSLRPRQARVGGRVAGS